MALLHITWIALNLSLAISLFIVSYRNFRGFSERYGSLASILVFVLVASMCQSPAKQESKPQVGQYEHTVAFSGQTSHWSASHSIVLLDWPTLELTQEIYLIHLPKSDSLRIASQTFLTGTVVGVQWKPVTAFVDIGADKRIHYSASGVLEWRLLGLPLYSQSMSFEGDQAYNPGYADLSAMVVIDTLHKRETNQRNPAKPT